MPRTQASKVAASARQRAVLRRSARYAFILGLLAFIQLTGQLHFVDHELSDARFRLATRPATGQVVLVEIDARSLAELDVWPWPRHYYATALDNLIAAGAERVAFDIDFSANSEIKNDQAFEQALKRHGGITRLAVFQQTATTADGEPYYHISRPLERFQQHTELASINVRPDTDGLVRSYQVITTIDGQDYPSIGTALANAPRPRQNTFEIDYGIQPATVPRISFVDVLRGDFDPAEVNQRAIIVGATAVELGDRLAVPIWQNISGPLLNIIAAESILQGRDLRSMHPGLTFLLAAAVVLGLCPAFASWNWRRATIVVAATSFTAFVATAVLQRYTPITVELALVLFALLLSYAIGLISRIDQQSLRILIDGLAAARRRALLQKVVEQSADGILILDGQGRTVVTNPAAARMFGLQQIAPDSPVQDLFAPATDKETAVFLEHLASSDPGAADGLAHEVIGLRSDDCPIQLELLVSEVVVNASATNRQVLAEPQRNMVCTIRDITERKRIDALKGQALEQSLEAARAKSDFLATMNHELRTPLNHIIGFAEMLREGYIGELSDKQRDYVVDIAASGKDLLHLISEILEYANLEKGEAVHLDEEDVLAFDLIDSCVKSMLQRARDANVTLQNATDEVSQPIIRVDQGTIRQALLNILSNAIKFNKPGGEVRVSTFESDAGAFTITVTDTGIGMTLNQTELALQAFSRVQDATRRGEDGHGLGLPLARTLIGAHGGSLAVQSNLGQGTTVRITIPANRVLSAPRRTASA